ncbi:MAG: phytanoyl-CoA dioxygenase family protein [Rhodospirillaceae bacterium]
MTPVSITEDQLSQFKQDGVICLRQVIPPDLIAMLAAGIDSCLKNPGPKGRNFNADGTPGRFAGDVFMWTFDEAMRAFLVNSPLAQIAASFMDSSTAVHMLDQMFVKEPQTPSRSPWHQDQTYMYADGDQLISIWVAVDPVTVQSGAVEWVKGSHHSGVLYQATGFDPNITYESDEYEPLPDIDANRDAYDIVVYETQPGDIVVNHLRTLHAAPGNATGERRRAVAYRFTGDDAHYSMRKKGSQPIIDPGLSAGDPMPCDLFPMLWPEPSQPPSLHIDRSV